MLLRVPYCAVELVMRLAQALFTALAAEKHGWSNATALRFAVT